MGKDDEREVMRKSMPSNYQIFDYWKDKYLNDSPIQLDWGEPSCWGCHKPITVETESLLAEANFKEIWNRTSGELERCHIIPKSLGGSNEPDNLFLMCPDCHSKAPNTTNEEIFFDWVKMQRQNCMFGTNVKEQKDLINHICEQMNIKVKDMVEFIEHGDFDISDSISTHGAKLNTSTLLMSVINKYKESLVNT